MVAYDYPLLSVLMTMLWFFLWVAWIVLLFRVIADIFRSHDIGGGAKALWSIFVIVLPFLGVFVYLLARGHAMSERDLAHAEAKEAAFQAYVRDTAASGSGGIADELAKLAELKDRGVLTDDEYASQKAKLLV